MWDAIKISALGTGGAVLFYPTLTKLRKKGRRISVQGLRADFAELLQIVASNWNRTSDVKKEQTVVLSRLAKIGESEGLAGCAGDGIFGRVHG